MKHFFGKYRGSVVNNADPMQLGRIQALVPDVSGPVPSGWALPCLPLAGNQMGTFLVPPVGAGVWMEFERGDPNFPIWTGCFWADLAHIPPLALAGDPANPSIVLQSTQGNSISLSDVPGPAGGILLHSPDGASILVNNQGITIQNGKGAIIELVGPNVTINNGALEIP